MSRFPRRKCARCFFLGPFDLSAYNRPVRPLSARRFIRRLIFNRSSEPLFDCTVVPSFRVVLISAVFFLGEPAINRLGEWNKEDRDEFPSLSIR